MKLKELLKVFIANAKIIEWETMEELGEYQIIYGEIVDKNCKYTKEAEKIKEREVLFINNRNDIIRIGIK